MPFVMKKGRIRRAIHGLADEYVQEVFGSWVNVVGDPDPVTSEWEMVINLVEKACGIDLTPLTRQSEGLYTVKEYIAACDGADVDAQGAVARARRAWQKPQPLLAALERFQAALNTGAADEALSESNYDRAAHLEVVADLIGRAKKSIRAGADTVCLEGDPFLM